MGKGSYHCGAIGYTTREWDEKQSVAYMLAQAGYHCINVGWRNLHPRRKLYGYHHVVCHDLHEGEDDYLEWLKRQVGPEACERGHGSDANGWIGRPWHLEERLHPTVWTTDVALEELAKRDPTKPFFLWISHLRPHSPYDPPQYYWDMYIDQDIPEPVIGDWCAEYRQVELRPSRTAWAGELSRAQTRRCRAGYMGCITHIDYEMGRLEEMLARTIDRQAAANTLWIFTSDHGDMLGDHYLHRKTYAWEGSARIPFLIKYPAGFDGPTGICERPVGIQDVAPTILEVCGLPVPGEMTGKSVIRAARGEPWREFIHGEHSPCYHPNNAMQYLTDGKEKYIWFPRTGREQFFDLTESRDELHDKSRDPGAQERVALWRGRLIELLSARGDGFADGQRLVVRADNYGPDV